MSSPDFFDFGNDVSARIEKVTILDSSVFWPKRPGDVESATESITINVAADPKNNLFAVFVEWSLSVEHTPRVVYQRIVVEFRLEDFGRVFSHNEESNTITPKLNVDKQFFGIAYQTLRGVVASRVAGTPWSSRLPSLVDAATLVPKPAER
jgi:hypothetical protein